MTVEELIAKLGEFPPYRVVQIGGADAPVPVRGFDVVRVVQEEQSRGTRDEPRVVLR